MPSAVLPVPGPTGLAFACAGLVIFIINQDSAKPESSATTASGTEHRTAPLATATNQALVGSALTNHSGAEAREDRIVALLLVFGVNCTLANRHGYRHRIIN